MTVQKSITYNPIDITGKKLTLNYELTLKVSETSEIIYYIEIFYDILIHKNKVPYPRKLEVKFKGVVENHGVKKVLEERELVLIVPLYGKVVV
jgi:hypothetical protein